MVTSAPEALATHDHVLKEAWRTAIKGQAAADYLRKLLAESRNASRKPAWERAVNDARG
jgi:hypothetical protein